MSRNTDLAKIHIGAQELGLIKPGDDSQYRDMLWTVARTRSSGDLDSHSRNEVIKHLKRCGWKVKRKGTPKRSDAQSRKIRSLWLQLRDADALGDPSEASLRKWASHQLKTPGNDQVVKPIELLTRQQRSLLIERLKHWLERLQVGR